MKLKIILFVISLSFSLVSFGRNNEKDFIKLIQKHDIPFSARELSKDEPLEVFWNEVLENNAVVRNLYHDIAKKKGAEKDAMASISRMKLHDYRLSVHVLDNFKGYCDTLIMDMGLPANLFELEVIYDTSPNAFAVLTKNGFAICLNLGLLEALDYDYCRIMGIVAHEFAHGAMFHHLRTEYEHEKKIRRDKITAGVAAGLTATAQIMNSYTSATLGTKYDQSYYEKAYEDIENEMNLSSLKFRYKYNREEEIEADIFAFRFLERLGLEEKYIEALQMIGKNDKYFWYDDFSDHPSVSYRLEFLNFIANHPEYKSEVKEKE